MACVGCECLTITNVDLVRSGNFIDMSFVKLPKRLKATASSASKSSVSANSFFSVTKAIAVPSNISSGSYALHNIRTGPALRKEACDMFFFLFVLLRYLSAFLFFLHFG